MATKDYPLSEENPQTVNEPSEAYQYDTPSATRRPPCQYTLEELNRRLDQAEEEDRQGLGCATEDLRKKHPRWKIS
ncbi:MAG: hypothetical protein PHC95_10855 [Parabacteroides sp.]|nr:hypothetical protein [Parabacteroides sp.]